MQKTDHLTSAQRSILRDLLKDEIDVFDVAEPTRTPPLKKRKLSLQLSPAPEVEMKTVDSTMIDETILELARQVPPQVSVLGSILRTLEEDGGSVPTKSFLKICALALRPGMVPSRMDAKEMVLAALHFLSSDAPLPFDAPPLPWIRPVQELPDLEKRSYEKFGDWTADAIMPAIKKVESIFYEATSSNLNGLPRVRFLPTGVSNEMERNLVLLKGIAPSGALKGRRKKRTNSVGSPTKAQPELGTSAEAEVTPSSVPPAAVSSPAVLSSPPPPPTQR